MAIDSKLIALLSPLNRDHIETIKEALNRYSHLELAELLSDRPPTERLFLFNLLTPQLAVRTFEYLPFSIQRELLNALPSDQAAHILNDISPDDRTAFLEELPSAIVHELLKLLSDSERAVTLKLLGYPEGSVGRLMTPDYLAVKLGWSVQTVLNYIRQYGRDSETINVIYVVDDQGVLIDDLRIREFLLASPEAQVKDLADYRFLSLSIQDKEEEAVNVFRKYNRVALPVIDDKGTLMGIVTIDDILNVANQESTEDIQKIGGMEALEGPYTETPLLKLMKKRVGWLALLFIGETFTASAMGYFEHEIARAAVLALFIPLIISSGGNSGSQASTLIIRAMTLNEIKLKDWWNIMKREILVGFLMGLVLGILGFFRVAIWGSLFSLYGPHWLIVAFIVSLSLIGVVMLGTLTGCMLPFILTRFGLDPAASSAPFVATIVDVTGIIIYFTVALILFHGLVF